MKKYTLFIVLFFVLAACNSNGTLNESKLNSAGDKLQKTVEKGADSIASKVGRFTDSLVHDHDTIHH